MLVMAAYNLVNGSRMTEHATLLRAVLKGEWGFDGFIESGTADLVTEMSIPFPAFAALRILGLPDEDLPNFSRWARLVFAIPGEDDGPKVWTPAWRLGLPLGHLAIHLF